MPSYAPKVASPRIYRPWGAYDLWLYLDSPGKTFAGDTGDVRDLAGRTAAGTRTNATYADGPRGKCLSFVAASSQVVTMSAAILGAGVRFSVSAWCRSASATSTYRGIAEYQNAGGSRLGIGIEPSGLPIVVYGSFFQVSTGPRIDDGKWHHVCGTFDGTTPKLYIDGNPVATGSLTGAAPGSAPGVLRVGDLSPVGYYWDGQLDDVRLAARAHSPAEVAREFADPDWRLRPPSRAARLLVSAPASDVGTGAGTLGKVTGQATGSAADVGSGSPTLGRVTGSATGSATNPGTAAGTLARVTGAATGSEVNTGSGSGTLGRVTGAGSQGNVGTGAGTLGKVTGSATGSTLGTAAVPLAIDGSLFLLLFGAPIVPPLPADLAAAIAARYAGSTAIGTLSTAIFDDRAGNKATLPYLVFQLDASRPALETSSSYWVDARIRFDCFAPTALGANALKLAVIATFDGVSLSYASGFTTPLIIGDGSDATERGRTRGNVRTFRATVEYSARARVGRS